MNCDAAADFRPQQQAALQGFDNVNVVLGTKNTSTTRAHAEHEAKLGFLHYIPAQFKPEHNVCEHTCGAQMWLNESMHTHMRHAMRANCSAQLSNTRPTLVAELRRLRLRLANTKRSARLCCCSTFACCRVVIRIACEHSLSSCAPLSVVETRTHEHVTDT